MGGFFFFQAEDGIRDIGVTGVQTCALPISHAQPVAGVLMHERPVGARQHAPFRLAHLHRVPQPGLPCIEKHLAAIGREMTRQAVQEIGRASCRERV